MHPVVTLIAQQEARAAAALEACVAGSARLQLAGSCGDGASALRRIEEGAPGLVCLDVRLPGLPELLHALCMEHPDTALLLTASEQDPAWTMLELHAVDPLPLPVARSRFQDCVEQALRLRDPSLCARALQQLARAAAPREILVHDRGAVRALALDDIESLQAENGATLVAGAGGRYLVKLSLAGFERVLDRGQFVKLHRRCIVNRGHILQVDASDPERVAVRMRSGARLVADPEAAARMRGRRSH